MEEETKMIISIGRFIQYNTQIIITLLCSFFKLYIKLKVENVSTKAYQEHFDVYDKIESESTKQIEMLKKYL